MATKQQLFLEWRGVQGATCERCDGAGRYMYSHGSTWRGGVGAAACRWDVCNACWGSGSTQYPGENLRALTRDAESWEAEQAMAYLSRITGISLRGTADMVTTLANLAQGQANKRKLPDGVDAFWWAHGWGRLADTLRDLAKRATRRHSDPSHESA